MHTCPQLVSSSDRCDNSPFPGLEQDPNNRQGRMGKLEGPLTRGARPGGEKETETQKVRTEGPQSKGAKASSAQTAPQPLKTLPPSP